MGIDWLPLGFTGGLFFWVIFIILGLLMPFFILINTFTLGRVLRELKKINKHLELTEERRKQETLGQQPRRDDEY